MCDHIVLTKQQYSILVSHITEDMDSLFISNADRGANISGDLKFQQEVNIDSNGVVVSDYMQVTEEMVLLAEYSLKCKPLPLLTHSSI